jgi:hypothetical protein
VRPGAQHGSSYDIEHPSISCSGTSGPPLPTAVPRPGCRPPACRPPYR